MAQQAEVLDEADADEAVIERELMMLARVLEAVQRKRSYPLERAEYIILRRLVEEGPQGVGHLARQLLLDDSTMTRQLTALREKGLVERTPDPSDGRACIVTASADGAERVRKMLAMRMTRTEKYVADWRPSERAMFGRLLGRFNAALIASLAE